VAPWAASAKWANGPALDDQGGTPLGVGSNEGLARNFPFRQTGDRTQEILGTCEAPCVATWHRPPRATESAVCIVFREGIAFSAFRLKLVPMVTYGETALHSGFL
jgi:hypothetical protein